MPAESTRRKPSAEAVKSSVSDIESILGGDFSAPSAKVVNLSKTGTANTRLRAEAGQLADETLAIQEGMTKEQKLIVRASILEASIESVRNALPDDRKSLGVLVTNLTQSFKDIGEEFAHVQEFNAGEQGGIDRAKENHSSAVARVAAAKTQLQNSHKKWNIFGRRDAAIAAATINLAKMEEQEKVAHAGIEIAIQKAEDMRADRLQGADFQQSFDTISACVDKTKAVLQERIAALDEQCEEAQQTKVKSFDHKQKAAVNMEKSAEEVAKFAAQYEDAVAAKDALEVGSSERVQAEAKVSELQRNYEQAKAGHDQQMVVFQSMEKATIKLGIDEAALRAGLHAHKVTFAQLVADSQVWLVEFRNRVAQIKAMASQQASSDLIQLGSAVRQANARSSAEFAIGSLANITEQAEKHPAQMDDLATIATAMAEGLQSAAERWKVIEDKTKKAGNVPVDG